MSMPVGQTDRWIDAMRKREITFFPLSAKKAASIIIYSIALPDVVKPRGGYGRDLGMSISSTFYGVT